MRRYIKSTDKLYEKFFALCINSRIIPRGINLLTAVSGGADSIALLHLLKRLSEDDFDFNLVAAHYNHRLRPEAEDEAGHVANFCEYRNIPLVIGDGEVESEAARLNQPIHAAAREMRYRFLIESGKKLFFKSLKSDSTLAQSFTIATGHHLNDQVETVLMRLFNGSGLSGLSGIRSPLIFKSDQDVSVIRPLLQFKKSDLIEYCNRNGLEYVTDKSNFDQNYPRNKIRKHIVPVIVDHFTESSLRGISRSSELIGISDEYISSQVEQILSDTLVVHKKRELALLKHEFTSESRSLRLHCIIAVLDILTESHHRTTAERLIKADRFINTTGNGVIEMGEGIQLCTHKDKIWFYYEPEPVQHKVLNIPAEIAIPEWGTIRLSLIPRASVNFPPDKGVLYVDKDELAGHRLLIRPAMKGERFAPFGFSWRKKISDFLSEHGVPAFRRAYPLIVSENRIVAIPPFNIDDRFRIKHSTREVVKINWIQT